MPCYAEQFSVIKSISDFSHQCCLTYCQTQPKTQLSWAESTLMLINPATRPPVRTISEKAGNEQNLLFNICRSTLAELKTIFGNFNMVEDDIHER